MNKCSIFFYSLIVTLFLFASILMGENSDQIVLDKPLPKLFNPGEIFYLKGRVPNAAPNTRVSIFGSMAKSEYIIDRTTIVRNDSFLLPIYFKEEGAYLVQLYLNSKEVFSQSVLATKPEVIISKPLASISNVAIERYKTDYRLVWNSANELIQLRFEQGDKKLEYYLSNHPAYFDLLPNRFNSFTEDTIFVYLRGARSQSGSLYQKCSDWGEWKTIFFVPTKRFVAKVKSFIIKFKTPFAQNGQVGQPFELKFYAKDIFSPKAYIKRPDGQVDVALLKTSKKPSVYKLYDTEISMAGPCSAVLTYIPNIEGTYLIEVTDREGSALINVPLFVGENSIPIITQSFENNPREESLKEIEQKILEKINQMRSNLGIKKLEFNSTLQELAHYYSNKMAENKFCGHYAPDNETVITRKKRFHIITVLNENVAMAKNPWLAQQNLENSPVHYMAMVDSTCEMAGIGIGKDSLGYYYLAQYFAPMPMTDEEKEQFLADLFQKMNEKRKTIKSIPKEKRTLKRVYLKGNWPAINKLKILAPSLERIREMVLIEQAKATWQREIIREVFFDNFEETVEGIRLTIYFYPLNLTVDNKKRKNN